jgi:hypothetical protein
VKPFAIQNALQNQPLSGAAQENPKFLTIQACNWMLQDSGGFPGPMNGFIGFGLMAS